MRFPSAPPRRQRAASAAAKRLTLAIENMHCGGCLKSVERAALGVPGVASARANLAAKRVSVAFDGGRAGEVDVIDALAARRLRRGADARGEAGRRHRAREISAAPRRGRGLCRDEHHAPVRLGVGRASGRHGPEPGGAVLLAVGADRLADGRLCGAALLRLGGRAPCGGAGSTWTCRSRSPSSSPPR